MEKFKHKSVFRRGAEDGVWFGIYLSALFIFSALSLNVPFLGNIATLMSLGVPIYVFYILRKGYIDNGYFYTFSEMWTHGIVLFFCRSLFMAASVIVYLKWVNPYFITDLFQTAIDTYRQVGGAAANEIASTLEKALDQNVLPTPFSLAGNLISFSVFSGSILSIILTLIIRHFTRKKDII